jgi:hypothetical protein
MRSGRLEANCASVLLPQRRNPTMTKKTPAKPSPDRLAKTGASGVQLSEAQLDHAKGGLNFVKVESKASPG